MLDLLSPPATVPAPPAVGSGEDFIECVRKGCEGTTQAKGHFGRGPSICALSAALAGARMEPFNLVSAMFSGKSQHETWQTRWPWLSSAVALQVCMVNNIETTSDNRVAAAESGVALARAMGLLP